MKNRLFITLLIIALLFAVSSAFGQVKQGDKYFGGGIGLWSGIGFSVNGEFIFKELPDLGFLGAGVELGFASNKVVYYSYTYIPIFAFGSFHYALPSMPKLDLYAKLGLGFVIVSSKYEGPFGFDFGGDSSYLGFAGQVGGRYAITEMIWVRAAVGTPWILFVGVEFGF